VINGYQYFATRQQFDACDVYVIDPRGLSDLCTRATDVDLCVVYVKASKSVRRKRAIERADDKVEAGKVFDKRYDDEREMFETFESLIETNDLTKFHEIYPTVKTVIIVDNEKHDPESLPKKAEMVEMYANQLTISDDFGPTIHRI
jgi:cytidylate kinase